MGALADLAGKRVYLDANVFIYGLDDLPPWNGVAAAVLESIEAGRLTGATSELTLAECLAKPFRTHNLEAVRVYEQSIRPRRGFAVVPVSREVLIEAARIRASTSAKLPDAIHVASYRLCGAQALLTIDRPLKSLPGIDCLLLSELKIA